jgi:hypothetical protein
MSNDEGMTKEVCARSSSFDSESFRELSIRAAFIIRHSLRKSLQFTQRRLRVGLARFEVLALLHLTIRASFAARRRVPQETRLQRIFQKPAAPARLPRKAFGVVRRHLTNDLENSQKLS